MGKLWSLLIVTFKNVFHMVEHGGGNNNIIPLVLLNKLAVGIYRVTFIQFWSLCSFGVSPFFCVLNQILYKVAPALKHLSWGRLGKWEQN